MKYPITQLKSQHASTVAEIHMASQSGTFLTALGSDFLTLLYKQISQSSRGMSYVALNNDEIIGFVVGTLHTKALFKEIALKSPVHLTWLVFKQALKRPILFWQAVKTLAYPAHGTTPDLPEAELLALAVDIDWRNQQIGSQLVRQLIQSMTAVGIEKVVVTVDGDNTGALRFYLRHGFVSTATFEMYGRLMNRLVLALNDQRVQEIG